MHTPSTKFSLSLSRRSGIVAAVAFSAYMFCGATDPNGCNAAPQPAAPIISTGQVVGTVAILAAVVIVPIVATKYHTHHNIKGCLYTGPAGLEIFDTGKHTRFILQGATTNLKVGDEVHIHGNRQPKQKGTDQTFVVESLNKTYGACTVPGAAAPNPQTAPSAAD